MPQAIPAIASAAATAAGATAAQAAIVAAVVAAYVANDQRARAQIRARRAHEDAIRNRNITLRSAIAPRTLALGTVRSSGPLMYGEFVGDNLEYLDSIVAVNHGQLSEVLGVYIGDEYIAASNIVDQRAINGKFGPEQSEPAYVDQVVTVTAATSATVTYPATEGSFATAIHVVPPENIMLTGVSISGTSVSWAETVTGTVVIIYVSNLAQGHPLTVQWALGSASQATTTWTGISTPKWTTDHRLRGVSYIRTLKLIDHPVFLAGDSGDVGAVIRGPMGVWDPRTSTTVNGTSNPALLAAWFRTLPVADGGIGVPSTWIDWASVGVAANVCDELISVRKLDGSGYEDVKRYECNTRLVLADGVTPEENLRIILDSMAGDFPFTGGMYKCFAGAFRSATMTLTDDDVYAGDHITFAPQAGVGVSPPNVVNATFYDRARNWVRQQAKAVENDAYIAADGAEELLELDLQSSTDERQANYLMGVQLERARPALIGALSVTGKGANIALMDTVQFNLLGYSSISGKTFEVRRRTNQFNGRYPIELREVKASTYTLDADRFTPPPAVAPASNSTLFEVDTPVITALAEQLVRQADGSIISRAEVTIAAHPQAYVTRRGEIRLRWRHPGAEWVYGSPAPGSVLKLHTGPLQEGTVVMVGAQAINGAGAASGWAVAVPLVVLGKTAPPANPSSVAGTQVPGGVLLTWALNTEADYLDTEVRAGASWAAGTLQWRGAADRYLLPWPAPGAITLWVAHRDTSKNYSASPASVGLTVGSGALIGTPQINDGAATDVLVHNTDLAGAAFGTATADSFTYTPPVNCTIEFTAKVTAANILGDSGNFLAWRATPAGGSAVLLGGSETNDTSRREFSASNGFAASGGVELTFELRTTRPSGNPSINLYSSYMRIAAVKR